LLKERVWDRHPTKLQKLFSYFCALFEDLKMFLKQQFYFCILECTLQLRHIRGLGDITYPKLFEWKSIRNSMQFPPEP